MPNLRCMVFGHEKDKRPFDGDTSSRDGGVYVCERCDKIVGTWVADGRRITDDHLDELETRIHDTAKHLETAAVTDDPSYDLTQASYELYEVAKLLREVKKR